MRVMFVCTANICRSPYAERRARALVGRRSFVEFASSGTDPVGIGPMDEVMARELIARGGDAGGLCGIGTTRANLAAADLVLTLTQAHRLRLIDDFPAMSQKYYTLGQFSRSIEHAGRRLHGDERLAFVHAERRPPEASDDVPDPYGQGQQAARIAADRIDDLLVSMLDRLVGPPRS